MEIFAAHPRNCDDVVAKGPAVGKVAIVMRPTDMHAQDQALARGRGQLQLTATRVVVKRTPGIGIYYDDSIYGAPHTLAELVPPSHFLHRPTQTSDTHLPVDAGLGCQKKKKKLQHIVQRPMMSNRRDSGVTALL